MAFVGSDRRRATVRKAVNKLRAARRAVADAFLFEFMQAKVGLSDQAAAAMIGEFRVWRAEHRE